MERMKKALPIIAVMLVPFGFLSTGIIHAGQHYAFILAGMLCAASMIRSNAAAAFMIYVTGWMAAIFIDAMAMPLVMKRTVGISFVAVIYILSGAVIYVTIARSSIKKQTFFKWIRVAALIQSSIAICQWLGFNPTDAALNLLIEAKPAFGAASITGTQGNPNFVAAFCAISLPFFFRKDKWVFLAALPVAVLLTTETSSAGVAAAAGFAAWGFTEYREKAKKAASFVAIAGILGIIYIFAFDAAVTVFNSSRFPIWGQAIGKSTATWGGVLFGLGPGVGWGRPFPVHSEWVGTFVNFGAVGIAMAGWYCLEILRRLKDPILFAAFVAIGTNLIGNSALHYGPQAALICLILGLIEREREHG
jgi:hypothetical protein